MFCFRKIYSHGRQPHRVPVWPRGQPSESSHRTALGRLSGSHPAPGQTSAVPLTATWAMTPIIPYTSPRPVSHPGLEPWRPVPTQLDISKEDRGHAADKQEGHSPQAPSPNFSTAAAWWCRQLSSAWRHTTRTPAAPPGLARDPEPTTLGAIPAFWRCSPGPWANQEETKAVPGQACGW